MPRFNLCAGALLGRSAWIGVLTAPLCSVSLAQPARFRGLGPWSYPIALSADGSTVIGYCCLDDGTSRWTEPTGWTPLPRSAGQPGNMHAKAVSADGSVVVGTFYETGPVNRTLRWTEATGAVDLGLPGTNFVGVDPVGMSADGTVIVGTASEALELCNVGPFPYWFQLRRAWGWHAGTGTFELLRALGGRNSSEASLMSGDATTVYGLAHDMCRSNPQSTERVVWRGSGIDLWPVGWDLSAHAASFDGTVVVGAGSISPGVISAVRWSQAGGAVYLGGLPGFTRCEGIALSADGSVIVGFSESNVPPNPVIERGAFIWDQARGMRELRSILTGEYGLNLAGWRLDAAVGISADGRTVAGSGHNPLGEYEAWIAFLGDPVSSCYANCDGSTAAPALNVNDYTCFLNRFAAGDSRANCDASTAAPTLNINDFSCFVNAFAAGARDKLGATVALPGGRASSIARVSRRGFIHVARESVSR